MPETINVTGHVVDESSGQGIPSLRIEVWPAQTPGRQPLARTTTGADGRFALEISSRTGTLDIVLKVFADDKLLTHVDKQIRRSRLTDGPVAIRVRPETPAAGGVTAFSGRVCHTGGNPVAAARIELYQAGPQNREQLAFAVTGPDGDFDVKVDRRLADALPDKALLLKLVDPEGSETATSGVLGPAPLGRRINFLIDDRRFAGEARFVRMRQPLDPLLRGMVIDRIGAAGARQDFQYLSRMANLPKRDVERVVRASQMAAETSLEPELFYACLTQGLPVDLDRILALTPEMLTVILTQAGKRNTIRALSAEETAAAVTRIKEAWVKRLLLNEPAGESLACLVRLALPKKEQAERVLKSQALDHIPRPLYWKAMEQLLGSGSSGQVARLKKTLRLGALAGGHAAMTEHLLRLTQDLGEEDALRHFTGWNIADFQAQIENLSLQTGRLCVPAYISGKNDAARVRTYAEGMAAMIGKLYPTESFTGRLERARPDHPFAAGRSDILRFTRQNAGFTFGGTQAMLIDDTHFRLDGIADPVQLKKNLLTVNRLFRLTTDFDQISALQGAGLDSSFKIAAQSKLLFVHDHAAQLGGTDQAGAIYDKALKINEAAYAMLAGLHPGTSAGLNVIPGIFDLLTDGGEAMASWRTMFGGLEVAETESCRTITSPAAYLADILHFLEVEKPAAYFELKRRRPDIMELLLVHENTEIALPAIDLVIELLEKQTAAREPGAVVDFAASGQTVSTADELQAYPDVLLPAAYEKVLKKAVYPDLLPFDLPLEELRVNLQLFDMTRAEIMQDLAPGTSQLPGAVTAFAWAGEYLGLTREEAGLLVMSPLAASSSKPWLLFGLPESGWVNKLAASVAVLLQQTDLTYVGLLKVLDTGFVNPAGADGSLAMSIVSAGRPDTANLDQLKLVGASADRLHKLARFVRLSKKLDLPAAQLDILLRSLQIGLDQEQDLINLAWAVYLIRNLNLPVEEAAALWGPFNQHAYRDFDDPSQPLQPGLFARLFQDRTVLGDDPGQLGQLADPAVRLPLQAIGNELASALGLRIEALLDLTGRLGFAETTPIGLDELARLYRCACLARILSLKPDEVVAFSALSGRDPFAGPLATCHFLDDMNRLSALGIGYGAFEARLIQADPDIQSPEAEGFVNALRQGLAGIKAQQLEAPAATPPGDDTLPSFVVGRFAQKLKLPEATVLALLVGLPSFADPAHSLLDDYCADAFAGSSSRIVFDNPEFLADRQAMPHLFKALSRMTRSAWLVSRLKLGPAETACLAAGDDLGVTCLAGLPVEADESDPPDAYARLIRLAELTAASRALPAGEPGLVSLLADSVRHSDKALLIAGLARLLDCRQEEITFLIGDAASDPGGILQARFDTDLLDFTIYPRLQRLVHAARYIGITVQETASLAGPTTGFAEAALVRQAARGRFSRQDWTQAAGMVRNRLRERQCGALTAFVVANPDAARHQHWQSHETLFEYLLVDVDVSAKVVTSRIKQAISSVQLFIDRILLGVESPKLDASAAPFSFSKEQVAEWSSWRKAYRVWEANRKIFLYPENWIEPELRDDKTPFFRELESKLKQGELTEASVEDAYFQYLLKLDQVARLDITCFCHDRAAGILHVIGRTNSMPYKYFYRRREDGEWSAWEAVNSDIGGDLMALAVWNRRLYLFWLEMLEEPEQENIALPALGESSTISRSRSRYKLQLSWSWLWQNRWEGRHLSRDSIVTDYFAGMNSGQLSDKLFLSVRLAGTSLEVCPLTFLDIRTPGVTYLPAQELGQNMVSIGWKYVFRDCVSDPGLLPDHALDSRLVIPQSVLLEKMKLRGADQLTMDTAYADVLHTIEANG